LIVDSLRYAVQEMHVDGFRFDLASILSRDSSGQPMLDLPVLWDIESDPALAGTKWSPRRGIRPVFTKSETSLGIVGGNGTTVSGRCPQLLPRRRGFNKADGDRLLGSPQIYGHKEAHGESNRDGANDNRSWNCGVEGPTSSAAVETLRNRQIKSLFTCTMLSLSVPMICMGDKVRRT
jgi:isoamylase